MYRNRWLVVLVAAVLVALGITTPGEAAQPADPPAAHLNAKTVTLITGDKVRIARRGDSWDVQVQPRPGRPVAFVQRIGKDHAYVIPSDAARLIGRGLLDKRLFDVAGLVAQRYDDASRGSLPLITTGPPAGVTITRRLPRTGLTAMGVPKKDAASLWERIRGSATKVWLDAKVQPVLDQSVPQVGAPSAWQAGFTGRGVNVAVLDTGIDASHPDLAGKVEKSRDFTGDGMNDVVGHGTHVASTIVGSGAASDGRYKGVAPDARLFVGKVLGAEGGPESVVIAGMEWAAAEGADVVNLSLGTGIPLGQSDPVAQAVNRLSKDTTTLFVVAAGNLGFLGEQSVTSPGSAAAALTVGSVSKSDVLSEFSSRGPIVDDYLTKPDLVAPGESIVAARAKGTLDDDAVDEYYARLDGTSMATPHVSGAAALLVQQHPDWDGEDVKAALTGSAEPVANASVFGQGAGRLDVARATRQDLRTDSTLDLGILRWPHEGGPKTKTVTYRNDGDSALTLDLRVEGTGADGQPLPAGTLVLQGDRLTVPAHGSAQVTLTYDLKKAPIGSLGGWIVATAGDVRLRTSVGGYLEPELYDVRLGLLDRRGEPARSQFDAIHLLGPDGLEFYGGDGDTLRIPPGRYVVQAQAVTPRPGKVEESVTFLAQPSFEVRQDGSITLDARKAKPVTFDVSKRDARHLHLTIGGGTSDRDQFRVTVPENFDEAYAGRIGGPASGYEFYVRTRLAATDLKIDLVRPERLGVEMWWVMGEPRLAGRHRLAIVDAGRGTAADIERLDVRDKVVVVTPENDDDMTGTSNAAAAGGAKAIVVWTRPNVSLFTPENGRVPMAYSSRAEMERFVELVARGGATVDLRGLRNSPYLYDLVYPSTGQPLADTTFRVRDRDLATVSSRYVTSWAGAARGLVTAEPAERYMPVGGWCCERLDAPLERTEYYTPGLWQLSWGWTVWDGRDPEEDWSGHGGRRGPSELRAGERSKVTWGGQVFGPAFADPPVEHGVSRSGDQVVVDQPLLTDGDGNYNLPERDQAHSGDIGVTRLFRDGELVGTSEVAGVGTFTVPEGPAELRLEADFQRNAAWWPTSTRVRANWTVHSAGDGVLPLLAVRYRPSVELDGYVRGGGRYRLPVSVQQQVGAPVGKVRRLAVQVSYDDGKTWRKAPLVRHASSWLAELRHPARGFVSLRAQAEDTRGNRVEQTIMRAYRLK